MLLSYDANFHPSTENLHKEDSNLLTTSFPTSTIADYSEYIDQVTSSTGIFPQNSSMALPLSLMDHINNPTTTHQLQSQVTTSSLSPNPVSSSLMLSLSNQTHLEQLPALEAIPSGVGSNHTSPTENSEDSRIYHYHPQLTSAFGGLDADLNYAIPMESTSSAPSNYTATLSAYSSGASHTSFFGMQPSSHAGLSHPHHTSYISSSTETPFCYPPYPAYPITSATNPDGSFHSPTNHNGLFLSETMASTQGQLLQQQMYEAYNSRGIYYGDIQSVGGNHNNSSLWQRNNHSSHNKMAKIVPVFQMTNCDIQNGTTGVTQLSPLDGSSTSPSLRSSPSDPYASELIQSGHLHHHGQARSHIHSSSASSMPPLDSSQLCLVCGDTAACQHYGVRTCEGCKGFFKRTIQKSAQYVCLQNKNCPVDKRRRNRCQFCRYQKCLSVGMVREVVRSDSYKGRRGRLPSKAKSGSSDSSMAPAVTLLSMLSKAHEFCKPSRHNIKTDPENNPSTSPMFQFCSHLGESLHLMRKYTDLVPGFSRINHSDQETILNMHGLDIIALRLALRIPKVCIKSESYATNNDMCNVTSSSGANQEEFLFENSCSLSAIDIRASGLGCWADHMLIIGKNLQDLIQNDINTAAGLSAVMLVNHSSITDDLRLHDASSIYALHHQFIEMLKGHCCSGAGGMSINNVSTVNQHGHQTQTPVTKIQSPTINTHRTESTFFFKVLDHKNTLHALNREHLLPLLAQLRNVGELPEYSWIDDVIRVHSRCR